VSLERLQEDTNGDLIYTCTHPWADGTTGIRLSPGGTSREAGGIVAPPAPPSGALWRLSGATQPPAWERHPHPTPARGGRGDGHQVAVLELGPAAAAGLCPGYGALPMGSLNATSCVISISNVRAVAGITHLGVCAILAQGTPLRLPRLPPAHRGSRLEAQGNPHPPAQKGF
jgi:hypothetical protein